MKPLMHQSAKPSHYDKAAEHYDILNEENPRIINPTIANILKRYHVTSVLDMTCGTGSQVFYLTKLGFNVVGSDINANMLNVAKDKARTEKLDIQFIQGDMRTLHVSQFDAVITIFNAIGHLTKPDFEIAIQNIGNNLKNGGLYIFDIYNLSYLLYGDNVTRLTIDWLKITDDTKVRYTQYSTIDNEGILASYTIESEQHGFQAPKISHSEQTLQIYSAQQLKDMLHRNGFHVLEQCDVDGSEFNETTTERVLTVARKK